MQFVQEPHHRSHGLRLRRRGDGVLADGPWRIDPLHVRWTLRIDHESRIGALRRRRRPGQRIVTKLRAIVAASLARAMQEQQDAARMFPVTTRGNEQAIRQPQPRGLVTEDAILETTAWLPRAHGAPTWFVVAVTALATSGYRGTTSHHEEKDGCQPQGRRHGDH